MTEKLGEWKTEEVNPLLTVNSKRLLSGELTYVTIRQDSAFPNTVILEPDDLPKLVEILKSLCVEKSSNEGTT